MADKGWTISCTGETWKLLDSRGEVLHRVSAAWLGEHGAGEVNAYAARRFWPPLLPPRPYTHLVLTGGPGTVEHQYLEPDDGVPELLVVRGLVFRLAPHCGHDTCPRHYQAGEHTG